MIKDDLKIIPIRRSLSKFRKIGYRKIIQNNEFVALVIHNKETANSFRKQFNQLWKSSKS